MVAPTDISNGLSEGKLSFAKGMPILPIWPGFAINTVFYSAILFALCFGFVQSRCIIHLRRGKCQKCAYPMGTSGVCTECGVELPGNKQRDEATPPE